MNLKNKQNYEDDIDVAMRRLATAVKRLDQTIDKLERSVNKVYDVKD